MAKKIKSRKRHLAYSKSSIGNRQASNQETKVCCITKTMGG